MGKQLVYMLWTGGWDSTFRLLQLAEENITIQPLYIIDPTRTGRKYELKAMNEIASKKRGGIWLTF